MADGLARAGRTLGESRMSEIDGFLPCKPEEGSGMAKEHESTRQEHGDRMATCLSATLCWYSVSWVKSMTHRVRLAVS